jgi:hypothetical protein
VEGLQLHGNGMGIRIFGWCWKAAHSKIYLVQGHVLIY